MNFWKTTYFASIATAARLLAGFVTAKFVAVYAGVSGFGIIGQFQSFTTLIQIGTGGAVASGVTKYSAEYSNNPEKLKPLIETAFHLGLYASLIIGVLISLFSPYLSLYIFQTKLYWWIFVLFGCSLFGYTLNQMILSVFNGLNQMSNYTIIAILSALFSMICIGILCYFFNTPGAILGSVLSQLCLFLIAYQFIKKMPVQLKILASRANYSILKQLLLFSLLPITTMICMPTAQIFLRSYVAHHSSWAEVGYWQALLKISDAYLLLLTTTISTYAVPKYSSIANKQLLKKEVFSVLKKILPLVILSASCIYIFRHAIILLLFSPKFLPLENYFQYQLMGDVVKIASWVMASVLIAKAQMITFIIYEIGFTISLVLLSLVFFEFYGVQGLTKAFFVNYVLYFSFVLFWFRRFINA